MNKRITIILAAASAAVLILILLFIAGRKSSYSSPQGPTGRGESALLNQANVLEQKGDLLEAQAAYQKLIFDYFSSSEVVNWQKKLEGLNIRLLFSPIVTPNSVLYQIKPGDNLTKIAARFNTTVELIKKSNNLENDKIFPGRKIKVQTAPFNIFIDKSQNVLILKSDEEVIKTYLVSTGKDNSTPAGVFKITNKLTDPIWFKAGAVVPAASPENVLGTRWIGFDLSGYGIHGTTDPQTLGQQVTQGCVRMANPDVEELYIIIPPGTEVTIVD